MKDYYSRENQASLYQVKSHSLFFKIQLQEFAYSYNGLKRNDQFLATLHMMMYCCQTIQTHFSCILLISLLSRTLTFQKLLFLFASIIALRK